MSEVPGNEKKNDGQGQTSAFKNLAVVQCDGFRCLAYRDEDSWRDFQTGKKLPGVLNVVFTFAA
jgi:hypothetical protein